MCGNVLKIVGLLAGGEGVREFSSPGWALPDLFGLQKALNGNSFSTMLPTKAVRYPDPKVPRPPPPGQCWLQGSQGRGGPGKDALGEGGSIGGAAAGLGPISAPHNSRLE